MKDERKDSAAKLSNKLKRLLNEHALVFLWWEKFLPGSDGDLGEQPLACSVPLRCTNIDEDQTPCPHYGVWGGH